MTFVWAMRVCDTHEKCEVCTECMCTSKTCVRQVSVCTHSVAHTVAATTCVRNSSKNCRKKSCREKTTFITPCPSWQKIFNSSSGFGECMYSTPLKNFRLHHFMSVMRLLMNSLANEMMRMSRPEHHAWEFFHSFHIQLVLVNSRPANCDSLMVLGQSSTSTNYSRVPDACLKRRNSCALWYFGVFHLVLSRRKFVLRTIVFSIFFDHFYNAFFQRRDWYMMAAQTLSAKIRFCVADK